MQLKCPNDDNNTDPTINAIERSTSSKTRQSTQWTPGYKNTKNSLIRTESSN